jgi:MFS family permease
VPIAGLRPLRHRAFAVCWSAGAASDLGTWVQLATIGSLVAASSGSAVEVGLIAAATFAPQGLGSPVGGVLADRFDRRRLFLVTLAVQALLTSGLALALFAGVRGAGPLALLVLVQSGAGAVGGPALQAVLPDLVPRRELTAAVSLQILGWNAGRVLGPLVAALLVPIGAGWAVLSNAVSFVMLWVAVALLRRRFPPPDRVRSSAGRDLIEGARVLGRTPGCRLAVATLLFVNLTYVPFMGLAPATARLLVERDAGIPDDQAVASVVGRLFAAQGVGAVVGSLALASVLTRVRRSTVITVALSGAAALVAVHAQLPFVWLTMAAFALMGAASATMFAAFSGVVQRDAPVAQRGRVLSWQQGTGGLAYGAGLFAQGALADVVGLVPLFVGAGVLTAAVVVACRVAPRWASVVDAETIGPAHAVPAHA